MSRRNEIVLARLPSPARAQDVDIARLSHVFEETAMAATTRRLYKSRFTLFLAWCAARGICAVPTEPEVLHTYLISLATEQKSLSTIEVSFAAITMVHRVLGVDPPTSAELWDTRRVLRLTLGMRSGRTKPISLDVLRKIVTPCGQDPRAIRDRALILVSYFAGLRRTDAVGLNREDIQRNVRDQLVLGVTGRDDANDPGASCPTLTSHAEPDLCPVRALDAWLDVRATWARLPDLSPARGPLFVGMHWDRRHRPRFGDRLTPQDVDRIIKRRAADAGLQPAGLSTISLRLGFFADRGVRSVPLPATRSET